MIELFAYNRSEGDLYDILEKELERLDVKDNPLSPEEMFNKTLGNNKRKLNSIASTLSTAILLIKGSGKNWENAYPIGRTYKDKKSLDRIEKVLKPIYDDYQFELSKNNEIDFEDMLTAATECIQNGYIHPYKYVIVDEYQDISRSRYTLLRELRSSKHYKLFCVGDDWQSIYRFNGSDVSYIIEFERFWGSSEICKIETTYRFSGEILKKSSEFVMRNSRQFKKSLIGKGYANSLVIPIHADSEERALSRMANMVERIPCTESVLFLGRYKHDIIKLEGCGFSWKPDLGSSSYSVYFSKRPDLMIKFMTIHSSKGLQADHVFILNNKKGPYGFPSMREESILISMLLSGENLLIDEERRLFYVALTRAKKKAYLLATYRDSSTFFKELFGDERYKSKRTNLTCPECGGKLILKRGQYGEFYGCSNYSTSGCRYTRKK